MSEKPPAQRVGVEGIDAHRPMEAQPAPMALSPVDLLHAAARNARFQSFVCDLTGAPGPATPASTVEALFKHIGATCWSDLQLPDQSRRLHAVFESFSRLQTATT
jgi:hypothetical protein